MQKINVSANAQRIPARIGLAILAITSEATSLPFIIGNKPKTIELEILIADFIRGFDASYEGKNEVFMTIFIFVSTKLLPTSTIKMMPISTAAPTNKMRPTPDTNVY